MHRLGQQVGVHNSSLLKHAQRLASSFPAQHAARLQAKLIEVMSAGVHVAGKDYRAVHIQLYNQLVAGYRFDNGYLIILPGDTYLSRDEVDQISSSLQRGAERQSRITPWLYGSTTDVGMRA